MVLPQINKLIGFLLATILLSLSGCASIKDAPFSHDTKSIDTSLESIGFMTVKISNSKNTSYQPELKYAFIWDKVEGDVDRERYSIEVNDPYKSVDDEYNEYVVSFQLKPGAYTLRELFAQSGTFPFVGTFSVPMFTPINVPANQVIYLGHIDANVVDKIDDNLLSAGPTIPLIDQAVTGASGGTFIINVEDRFEADTNLIRSMYNYLANTEIQNMTMPQWTQPTESEME